MPEVFGEDDTVAKRSIAVALSGGGSRAMAFHLGCLRALKTTDLLDQVCTISAVSGGSVIGALYCHTQGDFAAFERKARGILAKGFVRPSIHQALATLEGIAALLTFILLALDRAVAAVARLLARGFELPSASRDGWLHQSPMRRVASRTTILRRVFRAIFDNASLSELRADRPKLIIVACDLQHKSAFYFAADEVGSWRLGRTPVEKIGIGDAVSASAAYPLALPALDMGLSFNMKGETSTRRVILTDGGVYDNLGLSPLWPDRDATISLHVAKHSHIIACRAGYGLEAGPAPALAPSRIRGAFESIFARAQNAAVKRLFDIAKMGLVDGILHPYLGQSDEQLAYPPADLVPYSEVAGYPTDFSAMDKQWIDRLVKRGEQLTLALLREHWGISYTGAEGIKR